MKFSQTFALAALAATGVQAVPARGRAQAAKDRAAAISKTLDAINELYKTVGNSFDSMTPEIADTVQSTADEVRSMLEGSGVAKRQFPFDREGLFEGNDFFNGGEPFKQTMNEIEDLRRIIEQSALAFRADVIEAILEAIEAILRLLQPGRPVPTLPTPSMAPSSSLVPPPSLPPTMVPTGTGVPTPSMVPSSALPPFPFPSGNSTAPLPTGLPIPSGNKPPVDNDADTPLGFLNDLVPGLSTRQAGNPSDEVANIVGRLNRIAKMIEAAAGDFTTEAENVLSDALKSIEASLRAM